MSLSSSSSSVTTVKSTGQDESTSSSIQKKRDRIHQSASHSLDDVEILHERPSSLTYHENSTHSQYNHHHHQILNNVDHGIKLKKQTKTIVDENKTAKDQYLSSEQIINEYDDELNRILLNTNTMETSIEKNQLSRDSTSSRSSEMSRLIFVTTAVSLKDLLSYQDVMNAIEREFHLHEGQEREIIMKLWLKGQTMISILQRYRYLLQDLSLDDEDFLGGIKQIRDVVNYANRDVHYLREQTTMLENQNRFLENEFQRQLDKTVKEKNEQISRLIHTIDQTCSPPAEYKDDANDRRHASGNEELLKKFMQHNVELQREIETLRAKLEYTFTLVNEKLDQQKVATATTSSVSIIQTAFEQMRETEHKFQELKLKSLAQQEENDLLKYLMDKSQRTSDMEQTQLFRIIEQRALKREIDRVRHELEITEKKTNEFEQRFENSDEIVQFNIEKLKLKCDVLRQHIATCTQRLDEVNRQTQAQLTEDNRLEKNKREGESNNERNLIPFENELLTLRERYNELVEYSNTLKFELNDARKQIQEKEMFNSSLNSDHESDHQRTIQLENDLKSLQIKYEDVLERITSSTLQLERAQVVHNQTLDRCEQLEKEKSEINIKSQTLSQSVVNVTTKYKDKMSSLKSRLEQIDREKRDLQNRSDQLYNEIERLKDELTLKKDVIFEKEKTIQDVQYKNREILLERQSVEDRISNECKRLNELVDKNRFLEEELERMRRNEILESVNVRRTEVSNLDSDVNDSSNRIEELRLKVDEFERRFVDEKTNKESLQLQIKILEEENADLREIMNQMRRRALDGQRDDRNRNVEIQQLIARAEFNARQYMTDFNLTSLTSPSALVRIVPISSPTKIS